MRLPRIAWRWMHVSRVPYARNPNAPLSRIVLLLTTIGRKSGRPRVTPLQYEEVDGVLYVASARGTRADWYRNLAACPRATVQVGAERIPVRAELIVDPSRIADFLELRLKRLPLMVGLIMLGDGIPPRPARRRLEQYAARLALVALYRVPDE